ncbi:hypothetical protein PRIPAC_85937 [Pristionchus pacificus]|uniref:Uncharacterized protein n=1 Tax=Pristionchus pacificus TaxID=54126 RepID=A0A2A6BTR7_PRIPA|nr:hypothetical protein PRIPAC_85937 [Pristionchus pacificus]|eukprot:PDM69247.1 hypothetical protein PRIPAC_47549 [Pristionchus pacificus]
MTSSESPVYEVVQAYSPGYPFDASIPCDFLLNVEEGKNVELEVIVLEANTCCDHFIVYEDSIGSNIIAKIDMQHKYAQVGVDGRN